MQPLRLRVDEAEARLEPLRVGGQHLQICRQPTTADGVPPGGATNLDSAGVAYATSATAPFVMPVDPPHELDDVRRQLLGANGPTDNYDNTAVTNAGFVLSYEAAAGGNPRGSASGSRRNVRRRTATK